MVWSQSIICTSEESDTSRAAVGHEPTAVSHARARLRNMLDDELFVRIPQGMRPTPRV